MGNKMKKLICALLASAMLVGSVGVVGFADEDTNAETVVTTSAEATEKGNRGSCRCRGNRGSCCNRGSCSYSCSYYIW